MATVLSYAPPERPTLWRYRRYLGPLAIVVAVCSCALIVADTFDTRIEFVSYVQLPGEWCGSDYASLKWQLYRLPPELFVPCVLAAGVAHYLRYGAAISRVAIAVAVLGWAACAYVG